MTVYQVTGETPSSRSQALYFSEAGHDIGSHWGFF